MRILLPTDAFPPGKVGGAARSAHTLARALIAQGHTVLALVPAQGQHGRQRSVVEGVPVVRLGYPAPPIPFVQNYFRHERLWPRLADLIVAEAHAQPSELVIHAQHVQSLPAAIIAGRRLGVPVVATVRDHWPWDYFNIGLHGGRLPYARSGWAAMLTDLLARLGPLVGLAAAPAIPYMLAHLRRRRLALTQADAVIAVSGYIAQRLAPIVAPDRLHSIHNIVDSEQIARIAAQPSALAPAGPFLLFAGKLEPNKGADLLPAIFRAVPAARRGGLPPLLVVGDGVLRATIERELAELGVAAHFPGWAAYDELLRLMARCELLLFPSLWGEPLSRVPLEAGSLGRPVLAMPTGGTPDIVLDGHTGALAATPERFAQRMLALLDDPTKLHLMGAAARQHIEQHFTARVIVPQVEQLYRAVLSEQ